MRHRVELGVIEHQRRVDEDFEHAVTRRPALGGCGHAGLRNLLRRRRLRHVVDGGRPARQEVSGAGDKPFQAEERRTRKPEQSRDGVVDDAAEGRRVDRDRVPQRIPEAVAVVVVDGVRPRWFVSLVGLGRLRRRGEIARPVEPGRGLDRSARLDHDGGRRRRLAAALVEHLDEGLAEPVELDERVRLAQVHCRRLAGTGPVQRRRDDRGQPVEAVVRAVPVGDALADVDRDQGDLLPDGAPRPRRRHLAVGRLQTSNGARTTR
eukprot:7387176-Prymnesium_polylepis.1